MQGSDLVVPLDVQPVVVNGRSGDQRERNLELGTSWFQNPDDWAAMPADGGPDDWQRIDVVVDQTRREVNDEGEKTRVDVVVPARGDRRPSPMPHAEVSNVEINEQSLSFDVDQTGVPVLVKVSYFPNWEASGAEGPYRVGPNMMVVVPTSNHVELTYGRSASDYITILLTLVGIGAVLRVAPAGRRRARLRGAGRVVVARRRARQRSARSAGAHADDDRRRARRSSVDDPTRRHRTTITTTTRRRASDDVSRRTRRRRRRRRVRAPRAAGRHVGTDGPRPIASTAAYVSTG